MKKFLLTLLLTILSGAACADDFSIASKFKFWLLNNEARMLSTISFDQKVTGRVALPLAIIPGKDLAVASPVEKILQIHRKFYQFLDEIDRIYSLAKRYGNGRFSIVIKQARPEIWGLLPLYQILPAFHPQLSASYRRNFYDTLIKALDLNETRDKDLSMRLQKGLKKLSDEEFRLFNGYIDTFSALYPGDRSGLMIRTFIDSGSKRQFALGIGRLLQSEIVSAAAIDSKPEEPESSLNDPLAELEKLTAMSENDNVQISVTQPETAIAAEEVLPDENSDEGSDATSLVEGDEDIEENPAEESPTEEPEEPAQDMFNIWD